MRSLNCMVICLSCIVNWFALAYRPIGSLFSKKILKKNSVIRVLSGLIQSVSSGSLVTFNRKEFNLKMVASTFRGGGNDGQVLFDTNSFLKWWFVGNKQSTEAAVAERKRVAAGLRLNLVEPAHDVYATETLALGSENVNTNSLTKASATGIARSTIDSPSFLAGYMDFDPMVAATRSHSKAHHRGRRSSWFNRSD